MSATNIASALHLLLSASILWVVPSQHLFLADMVAFPVSLFLLLRDIVSKWSLATAVDHLRRHSIEIYTDDSPSDSSSREGSISSGATRRIKHHEKLDLSQYRPLPEKAAVLLKKATRDNNSRISPAKALLLLAHLVLFAMLLDFVYRPLISPAQDLFIFRPGHVSHDSARLHIRYPDGGQLELRYKELGHIDEPGFILPESSLNVPWESAGVIAPPTNATDFTKTTALMNLRPVTRYIVELHCLQPTLHAQTVLLGSVEFKTAPAPSHPARLRFATGSCIKPNFPYTPTLSPDIQGFKSMLDHSQTLDFVMFLGDFIYADLPLYFGSAVEDYRRLYRQVYRTPSARSLMHKVPTVHVYDDHEILNNWHDGDVAPMGSALVAYNEYNGLPNPPSPPNHAYYNFTYGDIAFYAWDTRRYRSHWEMANVGTTTATMLGKEQKAHFAQWLASVNHTAAVKFVISSVPLTTAWSSTDSSHDTWRGYPTERAEILALTQNVPNLFFLSGDRHEMAAVELPSGNVEFSTSPISQFTFPFVGQFRKNNAGEKTLHHRRAGHVKYGILDVDTLSSPVPRVTYSLFTTDVHKGRLPAWVYEAKCTTWR